MFKDKYIKDNEQIVPDEATKRYIKSKLIVESNKSKPKINYNAIIAAALSIVLAFGVVIVANNPAPVYEYVGETTLMHNMTYDTIYGKIKSTLKDDENFFYDIAAGIAWFTGSTARGEDFAMESIEDGATVGTDPGDSSETNNQVQGVDEADLVKNDGRYIYSVKDGNLMITDSNSGDPKVVVNKGLTASGETITGLFVNGDRLAVILETYQYANNTSNVRLVILDISDKENVTEIKSVSQNGYYNNSRMIGNKLYLLSNYRVRNGITKSKIETFIPCVDDTAIAETDICMIEDFDSPEYLVVSSVDLLSGEVIDSMAVLGGAQNVYCNSQNLYYTFSENARYEDGEKVEYKSETTIVKINLEKDKMRTVATGKVNGYPLNQFSMDEFDGNLRIVTTVSEQTTYKKTDNVTGVYTGSTTNALYVLDDKLSKIGAIENLAEGERVYSVRFDGKIGYFVTFRQVDPLFTVDLSDPKEPKVLSELKIPGFSEYLHPFGEGKLFGFGKSATEEGAVTGLKISMFDVSDPTNVTENHVTPIDAPWSEASENHKAIMVDVNKNIIAFLATDNFSNTNLYVYGYDDENGFFEKTVSLVGNSYNFGTRFVWINEHFYLVSKDGITVYSLDTFEKLNYLAF